MQLQDPYRQNLHEFTMIHTVVTYHCIRARTYTLCKSEQFRRSSSTYSIGNNVFYAVALGTGYRGRCFCYVSKVCPSILGAFLSIWTSHGGATENDLFEFVFRIGGAIFGFPIIIGAHCDALDG